MSHVNSFILTAGSFLDKRAMVQVCEKLKAAHHEESSVVFHSDNPNHNGKCFSGEVMLFALNYVSVETFLEAVIDADWEDPESVQVFALTEGGMLFKEVLDWRGGKLTLRGGRESWGEDRTWPDEKGPDR